MMMKNQFHVIKTKRKEDIKKIYRIFYCDTKNIFLKMMNLLFFFLLLEIDFAIEKKRFHSRTVFIAFSDSLEFAKFHFIFHGNSLNFCYEKKNSHEKCLFCVFLNVNLVLTSDNNVLFTKIFPAVHNPSNENFIYKVLKITFTFFTTFK